MLSRYSEPASPIASAPAPRLGGGVLVATGPVHADVVRRVLVQLWRAVLGGLLGIDDGL
jgi:hypothetical protein